MELGAHLPEDRIRHVDVTILDHVIGVRIPDTQPVFARLRRASARQALVGLAMRVIFARRLSRRSPRSGRSRTRCRICSPLEPSRSEYQRTFPSTVAISRKTIMAPIRASTITSTVSRNALSTSSAATWIRQDTTSGSLARLEWHNNGPYGHTLSHRPWSVVVSLEFPTEKQAVRFEKYLKSGSGRAFAKRHF